MNASPPPGPPPLHEHTLVLDGGLSDALRAEGCDLSGGLWTARALAEDPARVAAAHAAHVRAGAEVITTASYQASFEGFARHGIGRAAAARLFGESVRLARAAGAPYVAASVGPYGAVLGDGGEYRGRYGLSVTELERFHRPRVEALAAAAPDVLALETVPDAEEARALLRATRDCGIPVWLSFTAERERTRAGQPLAEAFALAAEADHVIAVGVNCCAPGEVTAAVRLAAEVTGKPAVAYPNSGEQWDAETGEWRGEAVFDPLLALVWRGAGARLIGGCCRVGPELIARIRTALAGS
ncbi:homocysteine S-methyltransferase [Streptomyces sp. DSM 44917]|uniref:Homocysteine S-methyltransferase n=1 Tax=Streptomyces boetiae TaxID=3075541 RepID=A0ABU2L2A0_9ACTN|nr:homocysteine S-methyltransferase [Streptomyces sp. DSM 44917]MDT0305686.1 homocysteine S-methyltransferase [Streptomyces sp. DSM 44917]